VGKTKKGRNPITDDQDEKTREYNPKQQKRGAGSVKRNQKGKKKGRKRLGGKGENTARRKTKNLGGKKANKRINMPTPSQRGVGQGAIPQLGGWKKKKKEKTI